MKVQVENAQQNEQVDWSKNPQLVVNSFNTIVLVHANQMCKKDEDCFIGTVIQSSHFSTAFLKTQFKPFHGTITLQND